MILHKLDIDYANYEVNVPSFISLNADGTITGAASGSWSLEAGTPYIELVIDGETYSGVALMQNIDGTSIETPVFTALGTTNQLTVWGSKSFSE
jgi:arabinan endo-1,5-alpha-L-arabinosidase